MIEVIFFDVDGVLVDSEKVFNVCWRQAARACGYEMSYDQALELRSLDSGLARELFLKWYDDEEAYSVIREARKNIMKDMTDKEPIKPKDGVKDLLRALRDYYVKIAIVTSSPIDRIKTYMQSVDIDINLFDHIITTEKVERGKPYPDVYTFACKKLGCAPSLCLAVEDSPNGIESAHAAGCKTVMIPDLSPFTEHLAPKVDWHFSSISEIKSNLSILL